MLSFTAVRVTHPSRGPCGQDCIAYGFGITRVDHHWTEEELVILIKDITNITPLICESLVNSSICNITYLFLYLLSIFSQLDCKLHENREIYLFFSLSTTASQHIKL